MRRAVACLTATCFLVTQTSALADPHAEGVAAGQAANPVARANVNTTSASTVVPGYTTTPPEAAHYKQPNLSSLGSARLSSCASAPSDPVCQAQRGAMNSASLLRAGIGAYQFQFGTPVYACRPGTVSGEGLMGYWGGYDQPVPGPSDQCFSLTDPEPEGACPQGTQAVHDGTGPRCATPDGPATLAGAAGWTLPLSFQQPTMNQLETDTWDDHGASLAAGGRCSAVTPERCADGPSTKVINGRQVTRDCWTYERTVSCSGTAGQSACAPLLAQGCIPAGTTCRQTNPVTGTCEVFEDTYTCPVAAQTTTSASNCPSNVFCFQGSCFDISRPPDADFGRSLSMLEAAREAGVYLDTSQMQVFKGEQNRCRDRLLKNCCYADGSGAGMTNQSLFGTGSRLVYDILMNSENQQFIYQGMSALLLGGGFSGSFTAYGVTVAVNGAAIPAGSVAVYSGQSMIVAFDPWSLVIAVIIYIILSMMSCNEEEGKLAMKEGAKLCHTVGTWCSTCFMVLGVCVSCTEHTTSKCCFNSMLARIINEQGRAQVGKGWGSTQSADCSGFTVAQLQSLNFAAMDLTEFYASLVPILPNVGTLQTNSATRVPTCYYGQGRCQ